MPSLRFLSIATLIIVLASCISIVSSGKLRNFSSREECEEFYNNGGRPGVFRVLPSQKVEWGEDPCTGYTWKIYDTRNRGAIIGMVVASCICILGAGFVSCYVCARCCCSKRKKKGYTTRLLSEDVQRGYSPPAVCYDSIEDSSGFQVLVPAAPQEGHSPKDSYFNPGYLHNPEDQNNMTSYQNPPPYSRIDPHALQPNAPVLEPETDPTSNDRTRLTNSPNNE